jgi:hypothetical protein
MGQDRTVRVVNFVSRASIEERILDLLRFKKSLFAGALDEDGADVVMVGEAGMEKFIRSVEEAVAPLATPDPDLERQERVEAAADERAAEMRELADDGPAAVTPAGVETGVGATTGPRAAMLTGDEGKVGKDAGIGVVSGNATWSETGVPADGGSGSRFRTGLGGTGGGAGDATEALNTLLISGAQFLMSLSQAIARPSGTPDEAVATGESDGEHVQKALGGIIGRDEATGKTYLKIPMPEAEAMNRIVSGLGQLFSGLSGMNR